MTLSAGARLGPYEILSPIGAGGMGEVYKARDTRLGRMVAIKVSNEKFSERFEREARAVAALNHAAYLHAVRRRTRLPGHGVHRGRAGGFSKKPRPMPLVEALADRDPDRRGARCRARQGNPAPGSEARNILLTKSGVKLLDFGLAKFSQPAAGMPDETMTNPLTATDRSWERCSTCRRSNSKARRPMPAAISSRSAWCFTRC